MIGSLSSIVLRPIETSEDGTRSNAYSCNCYLFERIPRDRGVAIREPDDQAVTIS